MSDGRHMCSKNHGMLINCLSLFIIFVVAMAMVVMGDTCVQSITAIHGLLCW